MHALHLTALRQLLRKKQLPPPLNAAANGVSRQHVASNSMVANGVARQRDPAPAVRRTSLEEQLQRNSLEENVRSLFYWRSTTLTSHDHSSPAYLA